LRDLSSLYLEKIVHLNLIKSILLIFLSILILSCQNGNENQTSKPTVNSVEVEEVEYDSNTDPREAWQKPNLILDKLGDLDNRVVADIGAGTGYFSFRIVPRAKRVIAIEINNDLIALMENLSTSLSDKNKDKFETRLAEPDDPKLGIEEVDDILIVNVVGYFEDRSAYFRKCHSALRKAGKIHIIDYKIRKLPIEAPDYANRVYIHLIEEELEAAGFTNIITDDTSLEYQYIVQATKAL